MRVTSNSEYQNTLANLERAASDLARWQAQVSSARRLEVPSDDPAAAARSIAERAEIGTIDQYSRSGDTAEARLRAVDSVLSDVVSRLTAAQAEAGAALGTVATDVQREAHAGALEAIADALFSDLNTSLRGTFLFAGSATLTAPYSMGSDGTVSAYQGDGNAVAIDIDRARSVQVAFDGRAITQGEDAQDVFTCLSALVAAIRANDQPAIASGVEGLRRAFDRAVAFQAAVGTDLATLADEGPRLTSLRQAAAARVSRDEDANLAEALSQMSRADAAYESALAAIGNRSRLTLLDYLR